MKNRFVPLKEMVAARAQSAQERKAARAAALAMPRAKRKIEAAIKTLRENLAIVGCDDESLSNMLKSLEQKIKVE